jgi:hypothetical protein
MLPYKYSTCQDKVDVKLEVIGGAGVSGERGNLETRRQKVEKEETAIRGRVKSVKTKRLAKGSPTLA